MKAPDVSYINTPRGTQGFENMRRFINIFCLRLQYITDCQIVNEIDEEKLRRFLDLGRFFSQHDQHQVRRPSAKKKAIYDVFFPLFFPLTEQGLLILLNVK